MKNKPLKDWRELTQFLIREYLYIDPMSLKQWENTAKVYGENCCVCGKPLIPNKFSDEFEKKLLKHIEELLFQSKSQTVEQILGMECMQTEFPLGNADRLRENNAKHKLRLQIRKEIGKL